MRGRARMAATETGGGAGLRLGAVDELGGDVGGFVAGGVFLQEIGEEEHLEDGEHDEQLDEDDGPQRTPQLHVPEAFVVEIEESIYQTVFAHGCGIRCRKDMLLILHFQVFFEKK